MTNCNSPQQGGFYDYSSYSDLVRVPVKEPYEIISADKGYTWTFMLPFNKIDYSDQITPLDSVGLKNSFIVLYSKRSDMVTPQGEAWFVVDIDHKNDTVFTDQKKFAEFFKNKNVQWPKFYEAGSLFKQFSSQKKLPADWPGSSK